MFNEYLTTMPLLFNGFVIVQSVSATESNSRILSCNVAFPMASGKKGQLIMTIWPSIEKGLEIPIEHGVHYLEGKLTFANGDWIVEAVRLYEVSSAIQPFPPKIIGTASLTSKTEKNAIFNASMYAMKMTSNTVVECDFQDTQYGTFIKKVRIHSELLLHGVVSSMDVEKLGLSNSHFSFLGKKEAHNIERRELETENQWGKFLKDELEVPQMEEEEKEKKKRKIINKK
jgi:hypothetical protein